MRSGKPRRASTLVDAIRALRSRSSFAQSPGIIENPFPTRAAVPIHSLAREDSFHGRFRPPPTRKELFPRVDLGTDRGGKGGSLLSLRGGSARKTVRHLSETSAIRVRVNGGERVGVEVHSRREHNRKVRGTRQYIACLVH